MPRSASLREATIARAPVMPSHVSFGAHRGFGLRRWVTFVIVFLFSTSSWAQAPGDAGKPAKGAPVVTPPVVSTHVDAVYPPSALSERRHADVVLTVTVDADGHVSNVEVASSGGAELDEAAIVAVRQWTFVPAKRDGRPVASRIRVPFHFAPPEAAPELVETPKAAEPELAPQRAVPAAPPSSAQPGVVSPEHHEPEAAPTAGPTPPAPSPMEV